jgi:hypothetical protein
MLYKVLTKITHFSSILSTRRMWRGGSVSMRRLSSPGSMWAMGPIAMGSLVLMCLAPSVGGQEPQQEVLAPLVDQNHARRAHKIVERWLQLGSVTGVKQPTIEVCGLLGLRLTLRADGQTMGVGQAYRPHIDDVLNAPGKPIDIVPLLQEATRQALRRVSEHLADAHAKAIEAGRIVKGQPTKSLVQVADSLQIDIQLGYQLEAIHLRPDAPDDAILGTFEPGFHGLRLISHRQPKGEVGSIIWPASALAGNIQPRNQLTALLNKQGYQPQDRDKLARPGGPRLERFEVVHLVRPRGDSPIHHLIRGNVDLARHSVTEAQLTHMAQNLTQHLIQRYIEAGHWRGTYHPTSHRYQPPQASAQEAALAGYALAHYSRVSQQLDQGRPFQNIVDSAHDSARHLGGAALGDKIAGEHRPTAAALTLLTLIDLDGGGEDQNLRDQLGRYLRTLIDEHGQFRSDQTEKAQPINQATAAVIVAALAGLYDQTRDPEVGNAAASALEALWIQCRAQPNILSLYWIAVAHEHLETRALQADQDDTTNKDRAADISLLLDRLCRQQLIETPTLGPRDVLGGFALFKTLRGSPPSPDWRSAPLVGFLAVCLRDENMTKPEQQFDLLLAGTLGARFIDQLMVKSTNGYYMRSLPTSLGGIRLALWDNRLNIAPTAMSLLAVVELQESIAAMKE